MRKGSTTMADDGFTSRSVTLPVQPMDVCAHGELFAAGLVDGRLAVIGRGGETKHIFQAHEASCRSTVFLDERTVLSGDAEGNLRMGGVGDRSAGDEATVSCGGEDEEGCSTLANLAEDGVASFAAGFEDGMVEIYDRRTFSSASASASSTSGPAVLTFHEHTDYVSDMVLGESGHQLVSVSGDGTLSLYDLRKGKVIARSEDDADDEMLSVRVVKGGKKVVCGHQSGTLGIYSWGYWNDCSDRFPGHPGSVDAMVKIDEDTLLTGSSDGLIRIVSILPNKPLGIVGEHFADNPVERLCLEPVHSQSLLSVSHDNVVKVWAVGELFADDDEDDEDGGGGSGDEGSDEDGEGSDGGNRKRKRKGKPGKEKFRNQEQAQRSAFFKDL